MLLSDNFLGTDSEAIPPMETQKLIDIKMTQTPN